MAARTVNVSIKTKVRATGFAETLLKNPSDFPRKMETALRESFFDSSASVISEAEKYWSEQTPNFWDRSPNRKNSGKFADSLNGISNRKKGVITFTMNPIYSNQVSGSSEAKTFGDKRAPEIIDQYASLKRRHGSEKNRTKKGELLRKMNDVKAQMSGLKGDGLSLHTSERDTTGSRSWEYGSLLRHGTTHIPKRYWKLWQKLFVNHLDKVLFDTMRDELPEGFKNKLRRIK